MIEALGGALPSEFVVFAQERRQLERLQVMRGRTDSTRRSFWAVRDPIRTFEPFAEGLSSAVFCADGGDSQIVVLATTGRPNFKNNSDHRQSFELEVVNVTRMSILV